MDTLRHRFPLAVPTFHGNRMDVPRRLRPSRLLGLAERQDENSFSDAANVAASPGSGHNEHGATSNAARGHFFLCRIAAGSRVPVLRGGIRSPAVAGGRTPIARVVDSL